MKLSSMPLSGLEQSLVAKYCAASFPPATAAKAFARNLSDGYVKELSSRGRHFFAYCVYRYRRQYALTAEETQWVNEWLSWQEPTPEPKSPTPVAPVIAPPSPQQELFV